MTLFNIVLETRFVMSLDYKVIEDKNEWSNVLDKFKDKDIYFEYEYLDLYTKPGQHPVMFYVETPIGRMAYPFMLKDISYAPNFKGKIERNLYFDIATAYGYGGHLIAPNKEDLRIPLIKTFYQAFGEFCKEKNVVSEFIKFSPLLENHKDIDVVVDSFFLKKGVATDLQTYGNPLDGEVKTRKRRDARRRRNAGMKTVFHCSPKSFDEQFKIYNDTMDRNNADEFYYFPKEYFDKMLSTLSEHILVVDVVLEGEIIGFELLFLYGDFIHAHLSGTLKEHLKESPSDLSGVDVIEWGHKHNYKYFFTGCGLTGDEDDSLYLFKKAFSKNTSFDYYLGNNIWNQEAYDYLVNLISNGGKSRGKFFPLYRI